MILSDIEIKKYAEAGMISPFVPEQVRVVETFDKDVKVVSYGLSSYGYDLRLSPKDFRIFRHLPGLIVDPKDFNPNFLTEQKLHVTSESNYFVIPGNSYALGVSVECFDMPPDVTAIALGKSTYARCGVIANLTPIEAGWKGYLTLEFSNSSNSDVKIYANEGVCQLLFFKGNPCEVSYAKRNGKYQGQSENVTLARI